MVYITKRNGQIKIASLHCYLQPLEKSWKYFRNTEIFTEKKFKICYVFENIKCIWKRRFRNFARHIKQYCFANRAYFIQHDRRTFRYQCTVKIVLRLNCIFDLSTKHGTYCKFLCWLHEFLSFENTRHDVERNEYKRKKKRRKTGVARELANCWNVIVHTDRRETRTHIYRHVGKISSMM